MFAGQQLIRGHRIGTTSTGEFAFRWLRVPAMPTYRYSVLLCRDAAMGGTAIAIDRGTTAFAASPTDARHDLRNFLTRQHKRYPWLRGPDFHEAKLVWQTVTVRPEYRTKERIYPCELEVDIRIACVLGIRTSGQLAVDLPLLNIRFDYSDARQLPDLVRRYVLQKLAGLAPQELNRYLPPMETELIDFTVRGPGEAGVREPLEIPPTLKQVAEPMGDRAIRKNFARAWGRESEVGLLVQKLHRERANVLLVGEGGVGKTTLLVDAVKESEALIRQDEKRSDGRGDARNETSGVNRSPRYWLTSAGRIVAGMKYLGQWEARVEELIAELGEIDGVLCVEQLLELVRRGGFGPSDSVAAFLVPYLARAELRMVAEATPAELDACRRLLPGLTELFQIVPVRSFDRSTAITVLDRQLETAASGPGLQVQRGTGERIARLFRRFLPYAPFPGPSSGFARELVEAQARAGCKTVDADDAIDRFRRRTGLPELFLRDELTLDHDQVREWFRSRVIDQAAACEAATDVVLTFKAGLNDPGRPPAVLLFCGPTGVGKTQTALALAEYFFGNAHRDANTNQSSPRRDPKSDDRNRLIRLDMSEYAGFDAVARLLGPPNGDPGPLVNRIRRQPFSVLLLDEIEKASPDVFDTLMGVFDEGRLTDSYGRVTNFRSTIVIMTSNLGAGETSAVGFGRDVRPPNYQAAAQRFFRPEFFNRMDAVVTFEPLKPQTVRTITRRELNAIAEREGALRAGVRFLWGESLVDHLAQVGFDARYGARPLQRAIEHRLVAPLARWLLDESREKSTIAVDWNGHEVEFRIVER